MIDLSIMPNSSMTTRQLKTWIRRATQDLNRQFFEMTKMDGIDLQKDKPLLAAQRDWLIQLGTGKEFRGGIALGLTYKTKAELVIQARALRETYNIIESPESYEIETAKTQQAYETFIQNRPDLQLSEREYKEMVETLGAIGYHVLNEFGYESFIETYDEARDEGRSNKDILDSMVDTIRESRGQEWTTEDMIDSLRSKLDLNE